MRRKLYSYDIFDTLLYRKVPNPTDIFYILEKKIYGLWKCGNSSFSEERRKIEFWLRRFSRHEITIEDIYEKIGTEAGINHKDINIIQEIELQTEKDFSILNKAIVDEIKMHLELGDQVVLISDMYWHTNQIRDWLTEKDEIFSGLTIYISCDQGVSKKSGELFKVVREKEKTDYSLWVHTGDNRISDYEVPQRLGIKCIAVKGGCKYDFEKKLNIRNGQIFEVYKLVTESISVSNGNAFNLGASIVAPMLYQYVKWVITNAIQKDIQALYFVLRDGYILKKVADIIIQREQLNIRTEYIFGSRVAWRLPEITIDKLKNLSVWEKSNWIYRDPAVTYVPLERLGFNKEQVDILFGEEFGNRCLHSFSDFKLMIYQCLKSEEFVVMLEQNIADARDNLYRYLVQTIDFSESFSFVDTNSTGKTQADLNKMLKKINPKLQDLRFFYHTFIADHNPDPKIQFVFIDSKQADRRFPEVFFRAPYNQCYGYKEEKGRILPRLHESDKCAWNYSFDYDSYLKGVMEFSSRAGKFDVDEYVDLLLQVVNFDVVSKDLIQQIATMPFNPDIYGDEILDFLPKLRINALFHPFSELIYFPKGSYYEAGIFWVGLYKILNYFVKLKRKK